MKYGFEPVFDENSKVLILGSFPSKISRSHGFYYGNKRNRFWSTLGNIFNESICDDINFKKKFLLRHKIALYDIVCESDLLGSADDTLIKSSMKIADISFLLPPNTAVEKILCNGMAAFNLTKKFVSTSLPIIYLPSSSPANTKFDVRVWERNLL